MSGVACEVRINFVMYSIDYDDFDYTKREYSKYIMYKN